MGFEDAWELRRRAALSWLCPRGRFLIGPRCLIYPGPGCTRNPGIPETGDSRVPGMPGGRVQSGPPTIYWEAVVFKLGPRDSEIYTIGHRSPTYCPLYGHF